MAFARRWSPRPVPVRPHRRGARAAVVALALLTTACSAPSIGIGGASSSDGGPGGTLRVAIPGDPPTLDPHKTSAALTQEVAWHVYEGLFTVDENFEARPMLAESARYDAATGSYLIQLRQGVTFHDGSTLDAGDVVASLKRWQEWSSYGGLFTDLVTGMRADGPHRVVLELRRESPVIKDLLAYPNQQAAIMPAELTKLDNVERPVGTGPFRFVERRPSQLIRLARYDGYDARPEEPSGMAGRRTAEVAQLDLIPMPEASVRRDSVITGAVDVAELLGSDMYPLVEASADAVPSVVKPYWWPMAVFNKERGPFTDVRVRKAFAAALDMKQIMHASFGSERFYRLDPSLLFKEQQAWWSDAGADQYNQADPERARRLLAEAGYDGETVRWLTTREYPYMFTAATVAVQQLEAVGFDIELQVVDWATITERRSQPDQYEIFSGATTFTADPGIWPCWDETWPGWWEDPIKDRMVTAVNTEMDPEARKQAVDRLQAYFWDQVPMVKFGDFFALNAHSDKVQGLEGSPFPTYWNVSIEGAR